jgi:hypothetical protein
MVDANVLPAFSTIQCPNILCGAPMSRKVKRGLLVFGEMTMYERGNDDVNQEIRAAKNWKRTGEI